MSRKAGLGFVLALVAVLLLLVYSRPLSKFIVNLFFNNVAQAPSPLALAQIDRIDGAVFIKSAQQTDYKPVKSPQAVHHLDQIKTEKGSSAQLNFNSGWQIQLGHKTSMVLESYRPDNLNSPLLLTLIYGQYSVVQPGPLGLLFVSYENKIFTPQTREQKRERQVVVAPAIVHATENSLEHAVDSSPEGVSLAPTVPAVSPLPSAQIPGKMPEKLKSGDEETLSSSYIEGLLNNHAADFRRCQLNSLRDDQPAEGSILLSLTIQPNGKAQNVKILQNSSHNIALAECAKSVLERVQFRTFAGLAITLTYPLEFK